MHRVDTDGALLAKFSNGNPASGQAATVVDADWLNAVQEAIVDVIAFAGIGLVKGDDTQLRDAIVALIAGVVGTGGGSVPTTRQVNGGGLITGGGALAADLVLSLAAATLPEAIAQIRNDVAVTPAGLAGLISISVAGGSAIIRIGPAIIQLFRATVSANASTILTLPTTFPTASLGAFCNGGRTTTSAQDNTFVSGEGLSNVSIWNGEDIAVSVNILAIGY